MEIYRQQIDAIGRHDIQLANGDLFYHERMDRKAIAEFFHCKENEICFGDLYLENGEKNPYKVILGDLYFVGKNIRDLGELIYIGGSAHFFGSLIKKLGPLQVIGGDLNVMECDRLESLQNVTNVGGDVYIDKCHLLEDLGNLTNVGGNLYVTTYNCPCLTSLNNVTNVGENASISGDIIKSLGNLTCVGNDLNIAFAENINSLERVSYVGGALYCWGKHGLDFGDARYIKRFDCDQELQKDVDREFEPNGYRKLNQEKNLCMQLRKKTSSGWVNYR